MKRSAVLVAMFVLLSFAMFSQGKWEFDVHYSTWNIDMISSLIEENFIPESDDYDREKADFTFTSSGGNYGFSARYFPKGDNGSFSIGFSYERNVFNGDISGSYSDVNDAGFQEDVSVTGEVEMRPHSLNLNFRWELWSKSRIHPYFGVGLGMGPMIGTVVTRGQKTTHYPAGAETEPIEETEKELDDIQSELNDEDEGFPLSVIPILHVTVGVRGMIAQNIYLLVDFGFYDGISFRGGIAVRL